MSNFLFLSTLSLRRATLPSVILSNGRAYFYPRSPCGERPPQGCFTLWGVIFLSTLSLRRATDTSSLMQCQIKFLSTLSLRRATVCFGCLAVDSSYFYPRSPCGERLRGQRPSWGGYLFLSTLSLRRATHHQQ